MHNLLILLEVSLLSLQINSNPIFSINSGHFLTSPEAILNPPPIHIILKCLLIFLISFANISCLGVGRVIKTKLFLLTLIANFLRLFSLH